jgi:hypothetical protein
VDRDAVTFLHHGRVVLDEESATEADGEHVACDLLVSLNNGTSGVDLTSSSWRLGTLPDSNIVAFAMALESCDEASGTSSNDENVDS